MTNTHNFDVIGLFAGQGDFPLLIAKGARADNIQVIAIALKGFCSPEIEQYATQTHWIELGQTSYAIELLHQNNVKHLIMAGRVPHQTIFQYRHFDTRALKLLAKAVTRKADGLLGLVVDELKKEGITVIDSSLFVKSLMPPAGLLTEKRPLTPREQEDVNFGLPIARVIAGQDIGQTIIVKEKCVIAVEGLEGTDECIKRAGELAGPGCVIIKVSKPRQDKRFDIPVIGTTTIKNMKKAGATAIAFSASETLVFDKKQIIAFGEENDIAVIAVSNPHPTENPIL